MATGLFGGAYVGNPNIQRQGVKARALAKERDVNTLPDPHTYAAVSGLFGTRPDEMGFSVLHPQYDSIMNAAERAFYAGIGLSVAPVGAALRKPAMALGRAGERVADKYVPQILERGGLPSYLLQDLAQGTRSPATVFHGSPYKFDQFDSTKIGTGEGAQAYGYGIYTADRPGTASTYIKPALLAKPSYELRSDDVLAKFNGDFDAAIKFAEAKRNSGNPNTSDVIWNPVIQHLQRRGETGYLYKVDLPDEQIAKMLDWDKPLSQQAWYKDSPSYQELLETVKKEGRPPTGQEKLLALIKSPYTDFSETMTGKNLYSNLGKNAVESANKAREYGIPGIRYLDGNSRAGGVGSSNYVIFPGNESMLQILERNNQVVNNTRNAALAAAAGIATPNLMASPMYTDPFGNTIDDTTR